MKVWLKTMSTKSRMTSRRLGCELMWNHHFSVFFPKEWASDIDLWLRFELIEIMRASGMKTDGATGPSGGIHSIKSLKLKIKGKKKSSEIEYWWLKTEASKIENNFRPWRKKEPTEGAKADEGILGGWREIAPRFKIARSTDWQLATTKPTDCQLPTTKPADCQSPISPNSRLKPTTGHLSCYKPASKPVRAIWVICSLYMEVERTTRKHDFRASSPPGLAKQNNISKSW